MTLSADKLQKCFPNIKMIYSFFNAQFILWLINSMNLNMPLWKPPFPLDRLTSHRVIKSAWGPWHTCRPYWRENLVECKISDDCIHYEPCNLDMWHWLKLKTNSHCGDHENTTTNRAIDYFTIEYGLWFISEHGESMNLIQFGAVENVFGGYFLQCEFLIQA